MGTRFYHAQVWVSFSGSTPRFPPSWMSSENLQREAFWMHPMQTPEQPQLARFQHEGATDLFLTPPLISKARLGS